MNARTSGLLVACATIGLALGQAAGTTGNAMKLTKWMLTVSDLDRTYAFYHEAFGFEINGTAQIKKTAPGSATILKLTNSPDGSMFRNVTTHASGIDWNLEFLEFTNLDRHPAQFRLQDPGASFLRLQVRDIDRVVAAALKNGGAINSVGGQVLTIGKNRVVMLKDPDGFFIEVTQPDPIPDTAPADSLVVGGNFVAVVKDADKALSSYKQQLGLENQSEGWSTNQSTMKMFGTPGAKIHRTSIFVPATTLQLEFVQFTDIDTHPVRLRIADPGAVGIGLQVRDIEAGVAAFTANGGSVETTDRITRRPDGAGASFVRDLNGFLVELNQVAPPAAGAVR